MKNTLQLLLLLPCILLSSLESKSTIADDGLWDVEQSIEETLSDLDSHDIDGSVYKYELTLLPPLPQEKSISNNTSKLKAEVSYSFIRAPPLFDI